MEGEGQDGPNELVPRFAPPSFSAYSPFTHKLKKPTEYGELL
jgi:hypothetical protein